MFQYISAKFEHFGAAGIGKELMSVRMQEMVENRRTARAKQEA